MNRTSHASAMGTAMPAQAPLMAATTGFRPAIRYVYSPARSSGRSGSTGTSRPSPARSEPVPSVMAVRTFMSAPAQNARPAPVSTMPTTSGSASARETAWRTSAPIACENPFNVSGRFSVMVATGSSTS
jgi:hypothetical protein